MNEQMLERSEELLMVEVSDETLEAAAKNEFVGGYPRWPALGPRSADPRVLTGARA